MRWTGFRGWKALTLKFLLRVVDITLIAETRCLLWCLNFLDEDLTGVCVCAVFRLFFFPILFVLSPTRLVQLTVCAEIPALAVKESNGGMIFGVGRRITVH